MYIVKSVSCLYFFLSPHNAGLCTCGWESGSITSAVSSTSVLATSSNSTSSSSVAPHIITDSTTDAEIRWTFKIYIIFVLKRFELTYLFMTLAKYFCNSTKAAHCGSPRRMS